MTPAQASQRPHWSEALTHPVRSFHTVRHLHQSQIVNRALRVLRPLSTEPRADLNLTLLPRATVPPAPPWGAAFDGRSFEFLNRRTIWGGPDRWYPQGADDLWVYNLHYFRFIWATSSKQAFELIADWIDVNQCVETAAWQPYPISLRVREWIEWLLANPTADATLHGAVTRSIARQTAALRQRLEFHLMGNHLLENAITLCWAGLSLAGSAADEWLADGVALLRDELNRQVLADGSHDERSPMYQALLAEALLRLSEVASQSPKGAAPAVFALAHDSGRRMLRSLACLVHPDGRYALLNDTALQIAPSLESLEDRFGRRPSEAPPHHGWALSSAGYSGYCDCNGRYLVFDAGPIGPDHQPGHGHADTLSFELSARGRQVVTDTGVFTYAAGTERRYDRSTAAHNTIEIDGRDQSELWGAFRCARRASIRGASADQTRNGVTLNGEYRGPGRGRESVSHGRQIFMNDHVLAFTDKVSAVGQHRGTARLHFAPGIRLRKRDRGWAVLSDDGRPVASVVGDDLAWAESASPYHEEFGREVERSCLIADLAFRDGFTAKWWMIL
jgi:hypothetical protein